MRQRTPRTPSFGEADLAHRDLDVLLQEFDLEHDAKLGPRKLRCGMLMSYCLRGARLGGGSSDALMDEMMPAIGENADSAATRSGSRDRLAALAQ